MIRVSNARQICKPKIQQEPGAAHHVFLKSGASVFEEIFKRKASNSSKSPAAAFSHQGGKGKQGEEAAFHVLAHPLDSNVQGST